MARPSIARALRRIAVVFNLVMLLATVLIVAMLFAAPPENPCESLDAVEAVDTFCVLGGDGPDLLIEEVLVLWAVGNLVLVFWSLLSQPGPRRCQACGHRVRAGMGTCRTCGNDLSRFVTANR